MTDKRIAIVGSAGHMMGRCLGADIDAHDIVVRMKGQQITEENVEDLGRKWTYLATNLYPEVEQYVYGDTKGIICMHWIGWTSSAR